MSPLAEKLVAILEDRDRLSAMLAECRRQEAAKDETISSMQQTITSLQEASLKQSAEILELKEELDEMDDQIESVLLSSADPEDANLKSRVEAVFAGLSGKAASAPAGQNGNGQSQQVRVSVASAASQIAAAVSPSAQRPSDLPPTPARVNGNPIIPVATAIRVARSATPSPRPAREAM